MSTKITDNYFEYGVHKYFRGNAHLVDILTYGEKKDPVGTKAYLDPQNKVKREYITDKVTRGTTISVDWASASQSAVEVNGNLKVFGVGASLGVSRNYQHLKTAKVKLYNLFINEGPLIKLLNNDASGARNFLAEEGNDGRIVTEVWVCMEADLAEHFDTSGGFTFAAPATGLQLVAKGGTQSTQSITISSGTVFAYKMHKVKDWSNNKTVVENCEADYYG